MNNDQGFPGGGHDEGASGSPKRKKIRQRYAPKACVLCRRSKLKCSGTNPCRRCQDNGRRCFYSEDQTAAEALQNLSRPAPSQALVPESNGSGVSRRNSVQLTAALPRRSSDASLLGTCIEARMARIENMMARMESMMDRSTRTTPWTSWEPARSPSDGYYADRDTGSLSLAPTEQHVPESRHRHSLSSQTLVNVESTIYCGPRSIPFPFPHPDAYQTYLDAFFDHIHPFLPCIDQDSFRTRSQTLLSLSPVPPEESYFLALTFAIFACVEISGATSRTGLASGWQWYKAANELADKRNCKGDGDLSLIQFVVLETLYFTLADMPNAAYQSSGLAVRLCFQLGLHQIGRLNKHSFADNHLRLCIFRAIFTLDRQVALSCRRPYGIEARHFDATALMRQIERFAAAEPTSLLHSSVSVYMNFAFHWAQYAGEVYDAVFDPLLRTSTTAERKDKISRIDASIRHFVEIDLANAPLRPNGKHSYINSEQYVILRIRFNHLRLLLHADLLTLNYDSDTGALCGELAVDTSARIRTIPPESLRGVFRFYVACGLRSAIVILAALLVRDLGSLGLEHKAAVYAEEFRKAVELLRHLNCRISHRFENDLKDIVGVVMAILEGGSPERIPTNLPTLFPYSQRQLEEIGRDGHDEWRGPRVGGCGVPWV